jgi:L-2-hydroxyglutarate oxidase LhgO
MSVDVDCLVIGAGVVGLAIARELALAGREVMLIERADAIGTGTSSRNSEVIHAGIYYPAGSLKARLCVQGRELLYAYCKAHGVPHKRLGKLIVATSDDELPKLADIQRKAHLNGVLDLELLTKEQAQALEPALQCTAALLSPSTGIIDSHALMLAYQGDAENAGAQCVFNTPLLEGEVNAHGGFILHFGGAEPMTLRCNVLINSAGLQAPKLARNISGLPASFIPTDYLCKGNYFSLQGRAPFTRLIYPTPHHAGLGVHLTIDMGGQAKFGPDVEWITQEDYRVDPERCEGFYEAVRTYWPGMKDGTLTPTYCGLRPKISGPNDPAADFMISGPNHHGIRGLVNLFGIESPGLTSSLAIAKETLSCIATTSS